MRLLKLSNGGYVRLDNADFDWANMSGPWYGANVSTHLRYARKHKRIGKYKYTKTYLHRLVAGAKAKEIVDHVNGDTLDNRRSNLRVVGKSENGGNRTRKPAVGVYLTRTKRWVAKIKHNYKQIHLGTYNTFAEAKTIRDRAAEKLGYLNPKGGLPQ